MPLPIFLLLCLLGFFAIMSSTASKSPTLPLYAEYLGLSPFEIGLVATASTITGIFVNFSAGFLSDIYGRKKLLIVSGLVFMTAPFLYPFVSNGWELAAVRVYHGIATATFVPVTTALIADLYPSKKGSMMGLFSTARTFGRLIAPTLAGIIIYAYSFRFTYITCGVLGTIAFILVTFLPSDYKHPKTLGKEMSVGTALSGYAIGVLLTLGLIEASTYFAMQSIETFLPLYNVRFAENPWLVGLIFTLQLSIIALLKPVMGATSDKIGRIPIIVLGATTSTIGMITLSTSSNVITIVLSIIVFAIGVSMSTAATAPLATELLGEKAHGTAVGMLETIKDIGQASGPIVMGLIASKTTYNYAFLIVALIELIALLIAIVAFKTLRRK
ncbi:MAG: MFS transporter [Candidatus Baldrarchaeia archaeon]